MLNHEYKKFVTVGLTDTHIEYLKSYMAWFRQMTGEEITWNQAIMICVDKCLEATVKMQELKLIAYNETASSTHPSRTQFLGYHQR